MADKKYTQSEVDNIVRKNMIETQLQLSKQSDEIDKLNKQLQAKELELVNLKKREKLVSRALILADRRAKYIENTTRTRCAIEIDNLVRFSEKWNKFFSELDVKYNEDDKKELEKFDAEMKLLINSFTEMKETATALTEQEMAYDSERKRLANRPTSVDDRFKKLCSEFDMKVGDNATRKPGRPKKNTGDKKIAKVSNVPKTEDSIFDFDEALNPTEDLETILSELLGDDIN